MLLIVVEQSNLAYVRHGVVEIGVLVHALVGVKTGTRRRSSILWSVSQVQGPPA